MHVRASMKITHKFSIVNPIFSPRVKKDKEVITNLSTYLKGELLQKIALDFIIRGCSEISSKEFYGKGPSGLIYAFSSFIRCHLLNFLYDFSRNVRNGSNRLPSVTLYSDLIINSSIVRSEIDQGVPLGILQIKTSTNSFENLKKCIETVFPGLPTVVSAEVFFKGFFRKT